MSTAIPGKSGRGACKSLDGNEAICCEMWSIYIQSERKANNGLLWVNRAKMKVGCEPCGTVNTDAGRDWQSRNEFSTFSNLDLGIYSILDQPDQQDSFIFWICDTADASARLKAPSKDNETECIAVTAAGLQIGILLFYTKGDDGSSADWPPGSCLRQQHLYEVLYRDKLLQFKKGKSFSVAINNPAAL